MRSERAGLGALVAALALGGCAYEWDALRPRGGDAGVAMMDAEAPADVAADAGTPDAGGRDTGATDRPDVGTDAGVDVPVDVGTGMDVPVVIDTGPPDVGTPDTGARDTGPIDIGTPDTGPRDTGPIDVGTPDTGPRDTGPIDVGTPDVGMPDAGAPPCTAPSCPCSPALPTGWCAIGATCVSGACVMGAVTGALVITEIMNDLDGLLSEPEGEWIEVYNPGPSALNLANLRVRDVATVSRAVALTNASTYLLPRGYAVLARSETLDVAGGPRAFATYDTVALNNSGSETITIETTDGAVIDSVTYGSGWPNTGGHSKSLRATSLDAVMNNSPANWCEARTQYTTANYGTPGAANDCP